MPSLACRDAGVNCDWFLELDDVSTLLVENLKHVEEAHAEEMKAMKEKLKTWEIVMSILRYLKR